MHSSNNLTYSQIYRSHLLVSVSILIIVIRYLHSILCLSHVCVFSFVCFVVLCVSKRAKRSKYMDMHTVCDYNRHWNQINFSTITFFFRLPTLIAPLLCMHILSHLEFAHTNYSPISKHPIT